MQYTINHYQRKISWACVAIGLIVLVLGNITPNINGFLGLNWTFSLNNLWFITNTSLLLCTVVLLLRIANALAAKAARHQPKGYLRRLGLFAYDALAPTLLAAELFIALVFWPLFITDRLTGSQLILPKRFADNLGLFPNLCMHLFPVLVMAVSYFSDRRPLGPKSAPLFGMFLYILICTASMTAFHLWFKPGRWVYPPLRLIPTPAKLGIPPIALGVLYLIYLILRALKSRDIYHRVSSKLIRAAVSPATLNFAIAALLSLLGVLLYCTFQTMSVDWIAVYHETQGAAQKITQAANGLSNRILAGAA